MSTHNICFCGEIRKIIYGYHRLSGTMTSYHTFPKIDPQHKKGYLLTCASNKGSNQSPHLCSLISLPYPHEEIPSMAIQNVPSEDSDQTAQMCRLIWIFAGRTYLKVHFLMLQLNLNKCILLPGQLPKNAGWLANSEETDQNHILQHLIWVYTVFLGVTAWIQTALFKRTLDTTKTIVTMTIWLSRNFCLRGNI